MASAAGCGEQASSAFESKGGASNAGGDSPDDSFSPTGGSFGTDAAITPTTPSLGSPLCGIASDKCMPDDDGTKHNYGLLCATPKTKDAGVPPIYDAGVTGCRVAKQTDGTYAPSCSPAGQGVDGASCERGEDCAPGFDCVEGEKSGVCRRYCCSSSCDGHSSQNGGPTFCDIQKLVDSNPHNAPVCMPIKTCKLLTPGACGAKETCAIVTEQGDTGCVAKGTAKVGQSCDDEHCDDSLTCLGTPGNRKCYQLCKTGSADCPSSVRGEPQTCTTSSVFLDSAYGVCQVKK